MKDWKW